MGMTFAKHERIWLRQSPDFSESWLHDADPSVLGLGELDVLERERVQRGGGRLDMLLTDALVHNSRSRSIIALHPEIRGPA